MARNPPPTTGTGMPRLRRPRGALVILEAQRQHLRAARRRSHRRVGVQADEEIGLVVVGERRPPIDRHVLVAVAREEHAQAHAALDRRLQSPRHLQREILLLRARRARRALVVAAVARVDDDGPHGTGAAHVDDGRSRTGAGTGGAPGRRRSGREGGGGVAAVVAAAAQQIDHEVAVGAIVGVSRRPPGRDR